MFRVRIRGRSVCGEQETGKSQQCRHYWRYRRILRHHCCRSRGRPFVSTIKRQKRRQLFRPNIGNHQCDPMHRACPWRGTRGCDGDLTSSLLYGKEVTFKGVRTPSQPPVPYLDKHDIRKHLGSHLNRLSSFTSITLISSALNVKVPYLPWLNW